MVAMNEEFWVGPVTGRTNHIKPYSSDYGLRIPNTRGMRRKIIIMIKK